MTETKKRSPRKGTKPRQKKAVDPASPAEEKKNVVLVTDDATYDCQPATDNDGVVITNLVAEHPKEEPKVPVDAPARADPPEPAETPAPAPIVAEASVPEQPAAPAPAAPPAPAEASVPANPPAEPQPVEKLRFNRKKLLAHLQEEERKEKRQKEPQPPRTKFFSEEHPGAYRLGKTFGPVLHSWIIGLLLLYSVMGELMRGHWLFLIDWFNASIIGPGLVRVLTVPGAWDEFQRYYLTLTLLATILVSLVLYVIYTFLWRYAFRDYFRVIYKDWEHKLVLSEKREGRLYWWTGNMWYRLWDRLYRSPPRTQHVLYLRPRWRPIFNPFAPGKSMISLTISADELVEVRSSYVVVGHERPYRRRNGVRSYHTHADRYATGKIPVEQAQAEFDGRTHRLVNEMKDLTKGNSAIRLEKMRNVEIAEEDFLHTVRDVQKKNVKEVNDGSGQQPASIQP